MAAARTGTGPSRPASTATSRSPSSPRSSSRPSRTWPGAPTQGAHRGRRPPTCSPSGCDRPTQGRSWPCSGSPGYDTGMPPPPVEPRRGPSTTNKVFLGCAIAALAMGLVSIVVVGSAVWWAVSPGRQLPTAMAVGPATGGVVRFGDLGADDGMSTFIATFLEESERARPGNPDLPPWMRTWLRSSRAEGFKQWLPREGTLSLERTADGLLHPVAALNLRTYVRPMRIFMEKMGDDRRVATRSQHRGETLVVFEGGTTLCFVGGTLLVSGDADLVRGVLDRAA